MKQTLKRVLSLLLVISMLSSYIVLPASAEENLCSCGKTIHTHETCDAETCTLEVHTPTAECEEVTPASEGEEETPAEGEEETPAEGEEETPAEGEEETPAEGEEETPAEGEEETPAEGEEETPAEGEEETPAEGEEETPAVIPEEEESEEEDTTVIYDNDDKILYLNGAELTKTIELEDGWTIIASGENTIAAAEGSAVTGTGSLTVKGGKLNLYGTNGIKAGSVVIEDSEVNFEGSSCGIQVYNDAGNATVTLKNVDGSITGGYAGIYVNGECTETAASVTIEDCDLDVTSTATAYNNRARMSGITVYVSTAEKVESSITIVDSKVNAIGSDAGLAINNYLGDADATNSASSKINITNSTVVAKGTNGTWSGIFASVLGQHPDADSIITITDSSVYAVSPNTGILTSSQKGESKIILDNSILGASGKTALSMIEETSQAQAAELINGSTYVQMTPDAVMKGEIVNHDGKTIIATAGDGITYDAANNYYVIPQGSAVTENFTDGTSENYTFNKQAGGIGGFDYAKEEVWGFDVFTKWETGDIIIYTPEELIEFATMTQDGTLGDCAGRTVKLGADIDMTGYYWYYRNAEGTVVTDHRIPKFSGTFDGQGYTIKNMSYLDEYAAATDVVPLAFIVECYNAPVVLKDMKIDGITVNTVAPARFAGLVDHFTGWKYEGEKGSISDITVSNITVNSSANLVFGGMLHKTFGLASEIKNCHVKNFAVNVNGAMSGDNSGRCGGFIATGGEVTDFVDCSVENFTVNVKNTGGYLGGFIGGASVSGDFFNCDVDGFELNAEAKISAVGGFAGYTAGSAWGSNSTYENCDVSGLDIETSDVISVGAGGFIGNIYGQDTHNFINCTTEGTISGDAYAGGFVGWLYGRNANCVAKFTDCSTAVNIVNNDYYGAGFVGNFTPKSGCQITTTYTNCTASGDVFAAEPIGSFVDAVTTNADGIIGGTYSYDPENVNTETGETNNVAPGYRALDNGDGTWTVFPDNGKEVVSVAFHRWNDELNGYENWRTVEVFKDVDFFEDAYDNALNFSHPDYRFANGIGELDEEADDATARAFSYWTDAPDGTELVLDNEIEVLADMKVYAAYVDYVCMIVETGKMYTTLTAAVADANASEGADTIKMLKSIDFDSSKALSITGDVTIIGEGMTISRGAYTGTLFTVPAGSSLTLDGGITFDGSNNWIFEKELYEYNLENLVKGTVCADYAKSAEGGTVATATMFKVYGEMTVNEATVQNCFNTKDSNAGDGAIFLVSGAESSLVMDGAKINHVATYGANAVVALKSGEWYIKGDTMISNNFGGRNGGMCRNDYGQIYMSGGTIKDNAGRNVNGTFIMVYGSGSLFEMTGGEICGNSSVGGTENGRCATLYLHSGGKINITGGRVCHNMGGNRGGIDAYTKSALNINRADQDFDNAEWNESGAAAYTASNHPYIVDNISIAGNSRHDVGNNGDIENFVWWVTGGIYTQDVDEFCAEGYICIPYDDSERTDDYIVVPGYRVKYFAVEEVETTNEAGETTTEIQTTLVKKYFHMLPRDKFWYEMDERANYFEITLEEGGTISTWYTEKELTNLYDFENSKLESDLNLYGEVNDLTITYDYNGGADADELARTSVTTKEESYNPSKKGIPAPTKAGYTLTGWKYAVDNAPESTDMTDNGKWYMAETLTTDTRLIAQWEQIVVEEPEKEDPIPVELGTKTDEILDRAKNRYTVNIDVPGANGVTGHDEIILMVDGSYSLDEEWPAMKEALNLIGNTVLNGSGTTQLTLMAFGMGDNIVLEHVTDPADLAAALGELPGSLLYGRSSTNCEAGFDGVANYIKNHDNTLNDVHVVYISDGNINTHEIPRAFAQNWKVWATKFGALTVAQAAFEGTMVYGTNLPAAFTTVFGDRFAGATREEILTRAFGGEVTNEEFLAFADQVWADVYAYSGMYPGVEYPVSVAERAFVKYDKEMGTYIQDAFYYTTYKSSYVTYSNGAARTIAAAEELAAMDEVAAMYVVDYDSESTWMSTGITSEKSTFVKSNGVAGLCDALAGALGEMAKAPINNPVITDYMSKWVNLDASTLKIIDNNTNAVLWTAADGWAEGVTPTTAKNPPVVVELVDPADYAAGGADVVGNTSGDIYKLTWYLKDGAMLRSDNFRLSYEVTVDAEEEGFEFEKDYPANGNTFIEYTDDEDEKKGNDIDVPDVNAQAVSLKLLKVDENGNPITGAEFELFRLDAEGNKISVGTYAVDKNGEYTLELAGLNHVLIETKAPKGYLTAGEEIEITLEGGTEIKVEETKAASYENGTLTVVNRPPHAAVVLTIDMSGTMYRNKMGGKRYVDVAKAKAVDFVEQYAETANNGGKRMISVVCFDTDAKVQQEWIDISTAAGKKTALEAINKIKVADNGSASSNQVCTNFDGGVILSRNLLNHDAVKDIDRCFTILLSDGAPTVTVNQDVDTVGTIKSSFWGKQLRADGTTYQNARCGGGWTHPAEVDRTLTYLKGVAEQTHNYTVNGESREGIFIVGVGGLMDVQLFNDAVYGTSNGTRTADVKKKPSAFNYVDALQGYTQAEILKMTTGQWMDNLANRVDGSYVNAANANALQSEFTNILNAIKDTTTAD